MKDAKNHNIKVGYVYIYKNKTPFQIHFSEFIIRKGKNIIIIFNFLIIFHLHFNKKKQALFF